MHNLKSLAAASLALVLLAACGTSGGLGDILGGGGNSTANAEIRGTVDYVDQNSQSIRLTNVSGLTSMLSSGGNGSTATVYYETNTPVTYQGQNYRPENLERGDQVSIRVDESGNRLIAEQIAVTYNAGGTGGSPTYPSTGGNYVSSVRGTVRYVDTSRGSLEIDRGSGSPVFVEVSSSTPVYYSNQTYRLADLERGDEVDVRVRDMGNGRLVAEQVSVVRSVSGGNNNSNSSTYGSTVRGTVSSVDTSRRLIYLDATQWRSNFSGNNNSSQSMVVSYDNNTSVDVNGTLHPVNGLERGDVIDVQVRNLGGSSYLATRVILVRDISN